MLKTIRPLTVSKIVLNRKRWETYFWKPNDEDTVKPFGRSVNFWAIFKIQWSGTIKWFWELRKHVQLKFAIWASISNARMTISFRANQTKLSKASVFHENSLARTEMRSQRTYTSICNKNVQKKLKNVISLMLSNGAQGARMCARVLENRSSDFNLK